MCHVEGHLPRSPWLGGVLALAACGASRVRRRGSRATDHAAGRRVPGHRRGGQRIGHARRRSPPSIVSLSPTVTEMLFAVGAGDQVVAVDDQSDFPPMRRSPSSRATSPTSRRSCRTTPTSWSSDTCRRRGRRAWTALGVTVVVHPAAATLDETYAADRAGRRGDRARAGRDRGHRTRCAGRSVRILAAAPPEGSGSVYHELDDTYYSVTSDTFIGQVYEMFGLRTSRTRRREPARVTPSSPRSTSCDPIRPGRAGRRRLLRHHARRRGEPPGWSDIAAVRTGSVIAVDDDIASRWGPRIVEFVRAVGDALAGMNA